MTQLERSIEPPGRSPFSSTTGSVLDVLDLHALRPPDEQRVRVGGVDDVGDVEPELARLGDVLVGRVDLDGEVVQERELGIARLALVELDECASDLDARCARRARRGGREPELLVGLGSFLRRGRPERDVVEVVLDLRRRLDEPEPEPFVHVEVDGAVAPLELDAVHLSEGPLEARDPQRDVLERAGLARPLGFEQGQLSAARVRSDERERVGAVHDVHADPLRDEVGDAVPVRDPERDVVEGLGRHGRELTHLLLPRVDRAL